MVLLFGMELLPFVEIVGGCIGAASSLYACYHKYTKRRRKHKETEIQLDEPYEIEDNLKDHRIFCQFDIILTSLENNKKIKDRHKCILRKFVQRLKNDINDCVDLIDKEGLDIHRIHIRFTNIIQKMDCEFNEDFYKIRIRMFRSSINNIVVSKLYDTPRDMIWAICSVIVVIIENIVYDFECWNNR